MASLDGLEIGLNRVDGRTETYRATSVADFRTGFHFHDAIQMLLVTAGERMIETRGGAVRLQVGDCLVIPRGEPHRGWNADGRPASFKSLYIRPDAGSTGLAEPRGLVFRTRQACVTEWLEASIDRLTDGAPVEVEHALPQALLEACEAIPTGEGVAAGLSSPLRRIRDELIAHVEEKLSLEALARAHNMSKCHLVHVFSRAYGLSPYAYNVRHRINLARRYLADGRRPAEVALDLGFYDQSHFGSHFRLVTGLSPAAYQKKIRKADPGRRGRHA